ncbi:MAG: PDZ domain-containing protein [Clostridia bacterium]|nr:PDZ domain-containing protein [Clostridia bacterium]
MKARFLRIGTLALIFTALMLLMLSCSFFDETGTPPDITDPFTVGSYTYTSAVTTTVPVTTAPEEIPPLTGEELESFLGYVNYSKVSAAQLYYFSYYIGEYRGVEDCLTEIYDVLSPLGGLRDVTDPEEATTVFINAYARVLGDNYGYYYGPVDYSDYTEDISGEYTGIGVSVSLNEDGYADVLSVFPGSPAEDAGILPGDLIVGVGDEDFAVIGYQNAIDLIRGAEGTTVDITVRRAGEDIRMTVARRKVTEVTVEYKMLEGNIGYIRILSFDDRTYEQFVAAHIALENAGAESYVFDVRNNPGGTLTSVVAILEYILPDGPIVHMNYKHDWNDHTISSIKDIDPNYMAAAGRVYYENHVVDEPIIVLANGNTASAGELFTSSLGDYGVAGIVGETTYGKGVGQTALTIGDDGSALVITVFSYDPPTSPNYDGVGITPDVPVSLSEEAAAKNLYRLEYHEDDQLQKAVSLLTSEEQK